MMQQLEIDWTNVVHTKENNKYSQEILESRYEDFSDQCKTIYDLFKSGKKLTVKEAMNKHDIGDLRARVRDLRNAGVDVKDNMIGKGFKEYFMINNNQNK